MSQGLQPAPSQVIGGGACFVYDSDTGIPTAGTFNTGDIIRNYASTSGGPYGYRCTAGGSPGTWEPIGGSGAQTLTVSGAATLAQINAGTALIAAVTGITLRVVNFRLQVNTSFITATDIRLSDTASSPVDIVTLAIANATDGNIITPDGGTGITIGAGYNAALTASKGVQIRKTGSTAASGVSIGYMIQYLVNA